MKKFFMILLAFSFLFTLSSLAEDGSFGSAGTTCGDTTVTITCVSEDGFCHCGAGPDNAYCTAYDSEGRYLGTLSVQCIQ